MSYQVIHVQKLKGSAIGGVEIHSEREREGVSHTNPDIDWSRTELNYQLHEPALHARGTYARRIDDRLREAGIARVRKDAVKLCGVVISSDREFFSQLSAEQQREFFQRSYDFMAARYGKENILSAVVHMDETTPHMHLYLVPITPDNRLCCKEIFDKRGLAALHDEFYRDVSKAYGLERGESADKGKRREHFDTQEFKAYTAAIEEKQEQLVEARQTLSNARDELHGIEAAYNTQKAFVAHCEAISDPSNPYPDWVQEKKHIFGEPTVTMPKEKWEAFHVASQAHDGVSSAVQVLDAAMSGFKRSTATESIISELKSQVQQLKAENKQLKSENGQLKDDNRALEWHIKLEKANTDKVVTKSRTAVLNDMYKIVEHLPVEYRRIFHRELNKLRAESARRAQVQPKRSRNDLER